MVLGPPCPRSTGMCPNNNIIIMDANAIMNLIKVKLPEKINHTIPQTYQTYFNNFIDREYKSLLEKICECSRIKDDKDTEKPEVYITERVFKEIDMQNYKSPLRNDSKFKMFGEICQNYKDRERVNNFHLDTLRKEKIEEKDLIKLKQKFSDKIRKIKLINPDADLSNIILALHKSLKMSYDSIIITSDEKLKLFIKTIKVSNEDVSFSFGTTNFSRIAPIDLYEYLMEIYKCCKMKSKEYFPLREVLNMLLFKRMAYNLKDPFVKYHKTELYRTLGNKFIEISENKNE